MSSCIPGASTSACGNQCSQGNICLVLLVGIPASGKSHFRTFLENHFTDNLIPDLGTVTVFSVSYDKFSKVRNPNQSSDSATWKEDRLGIFKNIETIIRYLRKDEVHNFEDALENINVINSEVSNPETILFIIDDNMYYRSMRYEFYKLSRTYRLSFCQIFFNAALQDAIEYNKKREPHSQVPDFVIEKMFEKLEPPDQTLPWEKNMLNLTPYLDLKKDSVLDSVFYVIKSALKCPVQQSAESFNKEESQRINNSNAIHQIDNLLKQLVGNLIRTKIKKGCDDPSAISQYFSEERLRILREIKERKFVLPVDLSEHISKNDIDIVKPILSKLLCPSFD